MASHIVLIEEGCGWVDVRKSAEQSLAVKRLGSNQTKSGLSMWLSLNHSVLSVIKSLDYLKKKIVHAKFLLHIPNSKKYQC